LLPGSTKSKTHTALERQLRRYTLDLKIEKPWHGDPCRFLFTNFCDFSFANL
jgi:hypothetical protein